MVLTIFQMDDMYKKELTINELSNLKKTQKTKQKTEMTRKYIL